ncbi:MAG: hypothetical protein GWN00_09290 [Aliifodinibius sp.]|nr:hypothetical protein [Fodinibius sp.]NIV11359.1 hypothetical protein [Fodinibius sp.]NIY24989.1 hypothetical protein [Fodinibius sp.]
MVTSLPIAADLNKNTILKIFSQSTGCGDSLDYQDIFAAWENRWSGTWSNGVPQYHCWYSSSQFNDRWIQPVTISEFDFIELCYTETMINKGKADIAINVYCPKDGISGWVSKRQHGGLEIPHIGYRIDDTTLIWICQIKEPAKLFERGEEWLIFLERVNRTSQPHKYQIYGKCVTMNKHICREKDNNTAHAGNYYAIHN